MVSELWNDKDYIANVNDYTTLNAIKNDVENKGN
jgi:hypothetical protein